MPDDLIRYDILAQDALRGVVRKVLAEVAKTGVPGAHHFYIRFGTRAPGVRVSSRLLKDYPEEMSIIIQHTYWDLNVTEHAFEVGLAFNGISERLLVPFAAVRGFYDPSVPFGLSFDATGAAAAQVQPTAPHPVVEARPTLAVVPEPQPEPEEAEAQPERNAEVVSLDAFRKKN